MTKPITTRTRRRRRARIIAPVRRRFGLRTRLTVTFALGAAALSAVLAFATFGITRQNLLDQRQESAISRAIANADRLATELPYSDNAIDVNRALISLSHPNDEQGLLSYGARWYSTESSALLQQFIPQSLVTMVSNGQAAQMRVGIDGSTQLIVGVPIADSDAQYYEAVPLIDLQATLNSLATTLVLASIVTTVAGALIGYWASRRVFAPLLDVGTAAGAIAGGRLDTRLPEGLDPDLDLISRPFNEMAQALEDRIERDARFASEVSHELRSPLMTLAASVEVLENTRDDLPERARTALALLSADIDRLQQLVEDLLEISRFDVGAITLHLDDVLIAELVYQSVSLLGGGGVSVINDLDTDQLIVRVDKRRFGRAIANLLDNADRYAGGATAVTVERVGEMVQIAVEDAGHGVPEDERDIVFDRFSRGSEAGNRSNDTGVGLGLALVDEHIRLHGGRVWVEDRRDGDPGGRFVIELPLIDPPTPDEADIEEKDSL
ncbi:MAG: HAMP domain-containing sensor histidine kinase [Acidimicrobiales bacterium]